MRTSPIVVSSSEPIFLTGSLDFASLLLGDAPAPKRLFFEVEGTKSKFLQSKEPQLGEGEEKVDSRLNDFRRIPFAFLPRFRNAYPQRILQHEMQQERGV